MASLRHKSFWVLGAILICIVALFHSVVSLGDGAVFNVVQNNTSSHRTRDDIPECIELSDDEGDETKWGYWYDKQAIVITLKINPDVVKDKNFKADWTLQSVRKPEVLADAITYLPPLHVNFLFDIDSEAQTPSNYEQSQRDAIFWYDLLWKNVVPAFSFDGGSDSESEKGFVYVSRDRSQPSYLEDGTDAREVYVWMRDALMPNSGPHTGTGNQGQSVGEYLTAKTKEQKLDEGRAPIWIIFRWHSIESLDTLESVPGDYALEELKQSGANVFLLMIGRSGTLPVKKAEWEYYERKWRERYRCRIRYVFVSDQDLNLKGQLTDFKQEVDIIHSKIRIPIRIPYSLYAEQLENGKLKIEYTPGSSSGRQCSVEIGDWRPQGKALEISWFDVCYAFLSFYSVAVFLFSVTFLCGLWVLKRDVCGIGKAVSGYLSNRKKGQLKDDHPEWPGEGRFGSNNEAANRRQADDR